AFHQHPGPHGGGHAVLLVVHVVVVEHVHRVTEPDVRVAAPRTVEPVVVVGHPQVPDVRGVPIAVAQQHRLLVVEERVPRHGHVIRLALDVHRTVVAVGEGVVVDPDMVGAVLHVDRVIPPVPEGQVPDDDVGDSIDIQAATDDGRVRAQPDDRLVRGHVVHPGEGDGARHLDHPGAGGLHLGYQLRTVRHGHGRSAGATGGGAVHGGPADQAGLAAATTATVVAAPDRDELELLVEAVQVGELRDPAAVGGGPLPHIQGLTAEPVDEPDVPAGRVDHLELLVEAVQVRPLPDLGAVVRVPFEDIEYLAAVACHDPVIAVPGGHEPELLVLAAGLGPLDDPGGICRGRTLDVDRLTAVP